MADELFKVIFKMEGDNQALLKSLDEVNDKYKQQSFELKRQIVDLQTLRHNEEALLKGRAAANNPTQIAKYNKELEKVIANIIDTTKAIENLTVTDQKLGNQAQDLGKKMNVAFDATKVNAVKNEVAKISDNFTKAEAPLVSLKTQLRLLKDQLAVTSDPKEFERLSIEAGKLQDKLNDAREAAFVFATGSPFESFGRAIRGVAGDLLNLDFEGAAEKSKLLSKAASQITFKGSIAGLKELGTVFLNVGKSLLKNPIFLLGAAITIVITKFNDLKNAGGLVGTIFRGIGSIIDNLKESFFFLTDAIGLTQEALKRLNEANLNKLKSDADLVEQVFQRQLRILKSLRKDTEQAEIERLQFIIKNADAQSETLRKLEKIRGELTEEEKKDFQEQAKIAADARAEILAIENESYLKRKDAAERYAKDIRAIFDDLEKRIQDQVTKSTQFEISTRLDPGGITQIEAEFGLRKRLEEQELSAFKKLALEKIKTTKDRIEFERKFNELFQLEQLNRNNDFNKAVLDAAKETALKKLDIERSTLEGQTDVAGSRSILTEEEVAEERLQIIVDYYNKKEEILKENLKKERELGFSTVETEKEIEAVRLEGLKAAEAQRDALFRIRLKNNLAEISEEERHADVLNQIQGDSESRRLYKQIVFEREKLRILKESGKATEQELKEQQNKIEELEKTANQKRILENIGYFEQLSTAAISATNSIINAKLTEIDKLTSLQEKRVNDAKEIADKGNAELYELEQKRLDDLNQQREKFVQRQQALATVELIANTAIAVSKAAAQGGVAAAVTIAAALIALTGGLIQARAIASQAAFYEGGYTGDGNPKDVSMAIGPKPYTYHKGEFVFDHQKTGKYKDIFQDIHTGNIDLNEWRQKVNAFEAMKFYRQEQTNIDTTNIEKKLGVLIMAIEGQSSSVSLDEHGFSVRLKNIKAKQTFLKNNLGRA